ncbi:hypothetical protein ABIE26_001164 [Pedobacter africanus]|uniref:Uncharacterized protein n=1 Tax=Pedobacter africanus TaxID=151894 RepID=A0ACC6KT89_9SPHI|nr:tetratricopeptide repeat protein [Pedobacter africanus]MDR6782348.1 hypothetical protein [Pedobacter africanus]
MIKQVLSREEVSLLETGYFNSLPLHKCQINRDWKLTKKACVVLSRKLANGNICAAFYIIDLYCTGVKQVGFMPDLAPTDLFKKVLVIFNQSAYRMIDCEYSLAYQLIEDALDYAKGNGIAPDDNFSHIKHMLDAEPPKPAAKHPIEFGKNGKPFLCLSDDDDKLSYYLTQLEKHLGEGKYNYKSSLYMSESEDLSHYLNRWTAADWNDFIDEFDLEDHIDDYPVMDYMFKKIFDGYEDSEGLKLKLDNFIATCRVGFGQSYERTFSDLPGELDALESLIMYSQSAGKAECEKMLKQTLGYIEKWPHNIEFRNFQIILEASLGVGDATARLKQMTVDFPEYLPARVNYARALTLAGDFDEARKICGYKETLDEICPTRTEFSEREFLPFVHFMAYGYAQERKIYHAYLYVSMLAKVDPEIAEMGYDDQLLAYTNGSAIALLLDYIDAAKHNPDTKAVVLALLG